MDKRPAPADPPEAAPKRPGPEDRYDSVFVVKLAAKLLADLREFASRRGSTAADEARTAIERHMKYPPPLPGDHPLPAPPAAPADPPA